MVSKVYGYRFIGKTGLRLFFGQWLRFRPLHGPGKRRGFCQLRVTQAWRHVARAGLRLSYPPVFSIGAEA
jgi:hypothetical protein